MLQYDMAVVMPGERLHEACPFSTFHFDRSPASLSARKTLDGLTGTMPPSSIMNGRLAGEPLHDRDGNARAVFVTASMNREAADISDGADGADSAGS
jgi:hypothetical protein